MPDGITVMIQASFCGAGDNYGPPGTIITLAYQVGLFLISQGAAVRV